MIQNNNIYSVQEIESEEAIAFIFISKGNEDIVKVVGYSYIQDYESYKIYNLGFGNYDIENDKIIDDTDSNNGDVYKVFNTVLSTIPAFFESVPYGMIMVQGSDGNDNFTHNCKSTCRKNCKGICRNYNRRLKVYRGFIDKNYDILIKDYAFYGGNIINKTISKLELYDRDNDYTSVFVKKIM